MYIDDGDRRNSAKALVRAGRVDELRGLADAGDGHAARQLAVWLARSGHIDELRERVGAGDRFARWAYSDLLVRRRRFPEAIDTLRPLADSGIPGAQRRLARLLAGRGRFGEAVVRLGQAPAHWRDTMRVESWLDACGLTDRTTRARDVRREYVDALRRATRAGDADARWQLSWIVLLWWRDRLEAAVALLDDIGPSDWLHERLVYESQGPGLAACRAAAIDLLVTAGDGAYRRTRAALLLSQDRRDDAIAQLRSLAAEGDRHAERDLEMVRSAPQPMREIKVGDHPELEFLNGLALSQDRATLAVWGHGTRYWAVVVLWDVATGEPRHTQRLDSPYPGGVTFRHDGTVDELPGRSPWQYPERLTAPDGSVVAVRTRGRIRLCDARTGTPIRELFLRGVFAMAFHPDGTMLAIGAGPAGVHLWELATGRLVRTIATPASAVAFRPDGAILATADSLNRAVRLWSLAAVRAE
ncbi:MAG: hypothetical protein GEV11_22135 [Streptosporangiales bacterium]|nr:hypothetical protein [Streptosporangiales bacterium]